MSRHASYTRRLCRWGTLLACLALTVYGSGPSRQDRLADVPVYQPSATSTPNLDFRDYKLIQQTGEAPAPKPLDDGGFISDEERNKKIFLTVGTGVGIITVWGLISWDYFSSTPHARDEGWFGYSRKSGGADKLGHAYTSYVTTHGLAALYESWDFTPEDAALYGAVSSFVLMTYMEFGDSFSKDHGFSVEDFYINTFGCVVGYFMWRYPALASKIDFRWEYGFRPYDLDITTDYENSKFLMAIKLNGWERFHGSWLRHLEFHVGYYTRGYGDDDGDKTDRERTTYVGIGFNISDLLRRRGYRKTAKFFNYYQLPFTYYPHEWNHDD